MIFILVPSARIEGMNLINCPDCRNEVSTLAASCPKCGRPLTPSRRHDRISESTGLTLAMLGLAPPIVMFLMGLIGGYALLCVSLGFLSIGLLIFIIGRFL
jgi:uncharacterized paraquat-inducible protein A